MQISTMEQISESHCGPAVITMLLDAIDIEIDQDEVRVAAGISQEILEEHGMRVDQLAFAVSKIAPQANFWFKFNANLDDIRYIHSRGFGVAVEWQGLFYDSLEEEKAAIWGIDDDDLGHYSIVVRVDDDHDSVIIVDPYKDFVDQNRIVHIPVFMSRWWDTNEIVNPHTNKTQFVEDYRLLFFITPHWEQFPAERKFEKYSR
jgi:hypothetical protein